jgi:PPK2 family polyphosphate:nucleotide phosphotransferase
MAANRLMTKRFRLKPGKRLQIDSIDPRDTSAFDSEAAAEEQARRDASHIDALQDRLYAEGRRALLVILQGIDTSGKDGTIKGVFNTAGPLGVTVTAFRKPSEEELAHDYLWRAHLACPRRGFIGIFNRSHYEDVLVAKARKLAPDAVIKARYDEINAFEKILADNGTSILKFMLVISKAEQKQRLQERLDDPKKRWKFQPGDLEDRKLWNEFMSAYEAAASHCSTDWAPWHIIPADRKWARNAAIAAIVRETLTEMEPAYPHVPWDPADFVIE